MGDRGQVKLIFGVRSIYFYSQSGGGSLLADVQRAIAKRLRWDDSEYLARIIFDTITEGEHDTETGFGIGLTPHIDIENPFVCVDLQNQEVWEENAPYVRGGLTIEEPLTFEEFVDLHIGGIQDE